ncbi:hypothetical protein C3K47_03870 [Solitalea longa]|uniref:VWA domain-containing protein n=1 Tax=Solitalea longa TaxID=2079460 RepID=A0A2S5A8V0_9SPHI|nr:hypothetical protein [Solitalea longa]POY38543.1 hypothetical protein C3K47_03870 [Solitalea longa]
MIIFSSVSPWWIIPCIILGLGYAWLLYHKANSLHAILRKGLFVIRALAVTLIAFLLLAPLIKTISRTVEKPLIIIASDNSSSILLNKEAADYKTTLPKAIQQLTGDLSAKFEVKNYSFGDKVEEGNKIDFSAKRTDFGQLFDELNSRFANRNVGAVILVSDGLYNRGPNPVYQRLNFNASVYTVALGDTTPKKDLLISSVEYNKIAYLGNTFRINVNVAAFGLQNQKTRLSVSNGGKVLYVKDVPIFNTDFRQSFPVDLEADNIGTQRYTVNLQVLPGEITQKNNTQHIFIDVLDARQKVLILADAPHPDLGAIKQTLENNKNYEAQIELAEKANGLKYGDYSLIILHQLPTSNAGSASILSKVLTSGVPVWFIIGNQTYIDLFNKVQSGASINNFRNSYNETQPIFQGDFFQFTFSEAAQRQFTNYPPLNVPFARFEIKNQTGTLLTQQVGSVKTGEPLLSFIDNNGLKTGYLFGEGIWRWRLANFQTTGNHDAFNEFLTKTVQYLTARDDKRKFRITQPKKIFEENEPIIFNAELYNDSYEPVNDPEVTLVVKNKEGRNYNFTFSRSEKAYFLNVGVLPVGDYTYTAKTRLGDKEQTFTGMFIINALNIEELQTTANHQLLYNLAKNNGGELIYPGNLNKLVDLIAKKDTIKPVSYEDKTLNELVNLKWLFGLIMALLTIEWFIRKRNGDY